jgi:hypothetical protein
MGRALILSAICAALFVPTAGADERKPIHIGGLKPDTWTMTTSNGEFDLQHRYPNVEKGSVYCIGVIMLGHESDSSFVRGENRWWDKLACGGLTTSGKKFAAIVDAKGPNTWIMYRLIGVSITDLLQ